MKVSKRTLKMSIASSIIAILFFAVFLITIYSYFQNRNTINNITNDLFSSISSGVVEKTVKYLDPAAKVAKISTKIFENDVFKEEFRLNFFKVGKQILEEYPQQTMFYFGNEQGNFIAIYQKNNGLWKTKLILRGCLNPIQIVSRYDDKFNLIKADTMHEFKYNPTKRPWYIGAKNNPRKEIYWSDVYVFATAKKPGITAAYPVYSKDSILQGVIGVDIEISKISCFLKKVKISKNGEAFILNAKNQVIGYKDQEKTMVKKDNYFRPAQIKEVFKNYLYKAFSIEQNQKQKRFEYEANGITYIAAALNFPKSFGKEWNFFIVAPKNDFFGALVKVNYFSMFISLLILLLAIFISILVSKNISHPIENLTKEVQKIEGFHLDSIIDISSNIKEVNQMVNSIIKMKNGLISFKHYVPAALVRKLIKTGEIAKTGGRKGDIAVSFTDIIGFTSILDNNPVEIVTSKLLSYFTLISDIILKNKGTVDKYIGDSVMSFWNAPEYNENYVDDACNSILECKKHLKFFNDDLFKKYKFRFDTRFGIDIGSAIIGNIGSNERMNYSVLGESINVASRLERLNTAYKTDILISEAVYLKVKDIFYFRPVDTVLLKGKKASIKIYELLDIKDETADKRNQFLSEKFTKAYDLYSSMKFEEAGTIFYEIRLAFPNDILTSILLKRTEHYIQYPPDRNWHPETYINKA